MREEFVGGINMPDTIRLYPPLVLLIPTHERLEFRLRLGMHRFFGPWKLERADVTLIYRELRGLDAFHTLGIVGKEGLWWTFYTHAPDPALNCFEELGYPLDPETRNGRGRFFVR